MNVVAIKCEACDDIGLVEHVHVTADGAMSIPEVVVCPLCGGSKVEHPPIDQDRQARRVIEGENEDE